MKSIAWACCGVVCIYLCMSEQESCHSNWLLILHVLLPPGVFFFFFIVPVLFVCTACACEACRMSARAHVLPGQGVMLHSWYSCAGPRQAWPPYLGSGLLQVLFRLRIPRLQSLLHCDQELQEDQPPFTVWPEILPRRRTSPVGNRQGQIWTTFLWYWRSCGIVFFFKDNIFCIFPVWLFSVRKQVILVLPSWHHCMYLFWRGGQRVKSNSW